jgi:hypothetical protein
MKKMLYELRYYLAATILVLFIIPADPQTSGEDSVKSSLANNREELTNPKENFELAPFQDSLRDDLKFPGIKTVRNKETTIQKKRERLAEPKRY